MTADEEITLFLEDLLAHQAECEVENCPSCQSLRHVCEAVRGLLFSQVVFPEAALAAHHAAAGESVTAAVATPWPRAA